VRCGVQGGWVVLDELPSGEAVSQGGVLDAAVFFHPWGVLRPFDGADGWVLECHGLGFRRHVDGLSRHACV